MLVQNLSRLCFHSGAAVFQGLTRQFIPFLRYIVLLQELALCATLLYHYSVYTLALL